MRRLALATLLLLVCFHGSAQTIHVTETGRPVALNGPWLIAESDSASPAAGWPISLESLSSLAAHPPEVLWLRTSLVWSNHLPSPALLLSPRTAGCRIYIDGVKALDCASTHLQTWRAQRGLLIPLPQSPASVPVSIAIQLDRPQRLPAGGLGVAPGDILFGSAPALLDHRTAQDAVRFYDVLPQALLCTAQLLGGALLLVLFAYDTRRREYLWFFVFLWLDGICSFDSVFNRVYPIHGLAVEVWIQPLGQIARYAPLIGFLAAFTAVRILWPVRAYQILLAVTPLALSSLVLLGARLHYNYFDWALYFQVPFVLGSLIFLAVQWRRHNREAALLLPSFLLANGTEVFGLTLFPQRFHFGRFGFDYDDLSMFFFLISIAPVMLMRHRRIGREHARATAELDAAREMQQRLVPVSLPPVPGFHVHATYLPANEVGGDFYQVLDEPDGSVLMVVGDVSGKGLKAAMTGALAIGALRTLATEGLGLACLLRRLNREMVRAQDGGFITCLCLRLRPDGSLILANAGHLAPYRNGEEISIESGLPLGLVTDADYAETTLQLAPGDTLTFLSDGVLEARNASGELFGFERTRAISTQSAEHIAHAAQQFGQEDDITVLTLQFAPAEVLLV